MTKLFICGTSHPLQCGQLTCGEEAVLSFESELKCICARGNIQFIAEEMTEEALVKFDATQTIGSRIAKELSICHKYVDLNYSQRKEWSIDDSSMSFIAMNVASGERCYSFRESFSDLASDIRERSWVARILALNAWPALLICGAEHSQSVRKIWHSLGLEAKLIHLDFQAK